MEMETAKGREGETEELGEGMTKPQPTQRRPSLASTDLPDGWANPVLGELVEDLIGGDWGEPHEYADGKSLIAVSVIRGTEFRNWDTDHGATAAVRAVGARKLARRQLREGDLVLEVSGGGPN